MFSREREAIAQATEAAKDSINVTLAVAGIAVVVATIALVIAVTRN